MLFGLHSVAIHVIVVGRAGALHLMDRFLHMLVNAIKIVPVADLC